MAMHSGDVPLPRSSSRKAKNNSAPKKQPQRGLGVAQLEKLRLQEQCRQQQHIFQPPAAAAAAASFQDHQLCSSSTSPAARSIISTSSYLLDAMSAASSSASTSSRGLVETLLAQQHQHQHPAFSWQDKENLSTSTRSLDSALLQQQQQRDHQLLMMNFRGDQLRAQHSSIQSFLDPAARPPDLRGSGRQQQLEFAMIGTPSIISIGNKPEELSSFQIYHTNHTNHTNHTTQKICENKRQRVESWLCLDAGSSENKSDVSYQARCAGPHFTTGLVRHALGSPPWTQVQQKQLMHSAGFDKRPCTGLSWNDSLTAPPLMNSTSSASSSRHICEASSKQLSCRKRGASTEPACEVEMESTFLALGLSSNSSESPKSVFHSSEEEDRGSNNQNGDMDNSSSGSHVQPWIHIGTDVPVDLNLRLSL